MFKDSVLKSVLEDELDRNLRKQVAFKNELSKLPKGSLFVASIHGDKYVYRKWRDADRIRSEYIGPLGSDSANKAFEERNKYLKLLQDIKDIKKEEKDLRRILKHND